MVLCFQKVGTIVGNRELNRFLHGLITGGAPAYFKFGEGNWAPSVELSSTVDTGIGVATSSGTIPGPPIVKETLTIDAGGLRVATDQPYSPWNGTGKLVDGAGSNVGTINYKTNAYSVTFTSVIPGAQTITATRQHRGQISPIHREQIDTGDGGQVYAGILACRPVYPGSVYIYDDVGAQVLIDDGAGLLVGGIAGTVDYDTGAVAVTFTNNVGVGDAVDAQYQAEGVPLAPNEGLTDLAAAADSELATYQKTLVPAVDMVFQGVGTGTVMVTMALALTEGNDDGTGNPPFWTEGGIFSENDVMLVHFTMPGTRKTVAATYQRGIELAIL